MTNRQGIVLVRLLLPVLDVPSSRRTRVQPSKTLEAVHLPSRQLLQTFQQQSVPSLRTVFSDTLPPSNVGWRITNSTYSTSPCSSLSLEPSLLREPTVSWLWNDFSMLLIWLFLYLQIILWRENLLGCVVLLDMV